MNGDVHRKVVTAPHPASDSGTALVSDTTPAPSLPNISTLSPTQQQRYRQDWMERENHSSILAAAGMVAESVRLSGNNSGVVGSTPTAGTNFMTTTMPVLGLQPPPTIMTQPVPGCHTTASTSVTELDSINWNLMDIDGIHLDDLDMDFATLFDPANEMASMPAPQDATSTVASRTFLPPLSIGAEGSAVDPAPLPDLIWSECMDGDAQQQKPP
jgi:hypothetical protein